MQRSVKKTLKTLAGITTAGASTGGALAAWGHAELNHFELHRYTLPILAPGALRDRDNFRILHVSDLHMIPGQPAKIDFVSGLDSLRPDLVINTGDNLSDQRAVPDVLRALGPLLRRPGLFVFGTNDYWAPRPVNPFKYLTGGKREPSYVGLPWKDMRAVFIEHGWLDANQARHEFPIDGLRIAATGVDDPHHDLDDYDEVSGPPHPDADLSLALLHSPEPRVLEKFERDGYMLSLSGHTHGGQICLPGGRAIITNCGIDPERASGVHQFGRMTMSVSNGLGTSKYAPVRLFCRPSAALLELVEG